MASFAKNLLDLTANDLMSRELILLGRAMSVRHAAHLLSQAHVSGAPVVDDEGRCVGVLSAVDFLRWVDQDQATRKSHTDEVEAFCAWQVLDLEQIPTDQVSNFMTANPVMAAPITPIGQLAQMMMDAHIHRVVIVDADQRPIGVVSTTDVLAAIAFFHARAHEQPVRTA